MDAAVKSSAIKITELVKRLKISRRTYYNHISDQKLPFDVLEEYGKVLRHDFTQDIPEMKQYAFEEPEVRYGKRPINLHEAIEHIDYWRAKYYEVMEQLHGFLMNKKSS